MGVTELEKPPAVWCEHCTPGKGCNIYEDRPPTCREFECLWLLDESWPEDVRPDKSHVVMAATKDGARLVANVDPARPNAYMTGRIGTILRNLSDSKDVIIVIGDKRKALTTQGRAQELLRLAAEERK